MNEIFEKNSDFGKWLESNYWFQNGHLLDYKFDGDRGSGQYYRETERAHCYNLQNRSLQPISRWRGLYKRLLLRGGLLNLACYGFSNRWCRC